MIYIDGEKKEAKEVAEMFNIALPKNINTARFKRTSNGGSWSEANDRWIFSGISSTYKFPVKDKDGNDHDFALTNGGPQNGPNNTRVFSYKDYNFQGHDIVPTNLEEYIGIYLHPYSANSNLTGRPKMWELENREAEAKEGVSKQDKLFQALSFINDPSNSLELFKLYCKGKGNANVDDMSKTEIMNLVGQNAINDPSTFLEEIESRAIQFKGIVLDAIDKAILVVDQQGGKSYWKWAKGPFAGGQICKLKDSMTREEALIQAFSTADNLDEIINAIRSISAEDSLEKKLAASTAMEVNVKVELVPQALEFKVFTIQGKLYKINDRKFFEATSEDETEQLAELAEFLKKNDNKRKELENAIKRKQTVSA